jgi:hypothetical protein
MAKRRRANKTGRSESEPRFVQIPFWVLESEAARTISPTATKVLLFIVKRHNGTNNGTIGFGARSGCFLRPPGAKELEDAPIGLAPRTVSDALFELERAGFIRCTRQSTFDQKRTTREWRLTWLPCGSEPPTKEFATAKGDFKRKKLTRKQKPERLRALSPQLQSGYAPQPHDENTQIVNTERLRAL